MPDPSVYRRNIERILTMLRLFIERLIYSSVSTWPPLYCISLTAFIALSRSVQRLTTLPSEF